MSRWEQADSGCHRDCLSNNGNSVESEVSESKTRFGLKL